VYSNWDKDLDETKSQTKQLEANKGYFWALTRLLVDIPRGIGVIFIVTLLSNWGLDMAMLSHPITFILVGLADVIVAMECLIFACCKSLGTMYKQQAKVYCFYSLTLGFPFGTATKILLLLHAGGNQVEKIYIPIPYFIAQGMGIVMISVIATHDCYHERHGKCCKRFSLVGVLFILLLWTLVLLNHAHVYNLPILFHVKVWLILLLPLWIIFAVAFVYTTQQFWLLAIQSCFQTAVPAAVRYNWRLQLLYMTPDMCLVYGYFTVALGITSQADGYLSSTQWISIIAIATESVSFCFTLLTLGVPICYLCHYKPNIMESELVLDKETQPHLTELELTLDKEAQPSTSVDTTVITISPPPEQLQFPVHFDSMSYMSHSQQPQLVPVDQSIENEVVYLMRKTWHEYEGNQSSRLKLKVKQVTKLENFSLLHGYLNYRTMMKWKHQPSTTTGKVLYMDDPKVITRDSWLQQQQEMDPQINEVNLWHRVSQEQVHLICFHGFACINGVFGKGIYFSEKSSTPDDSSDYPVNGSKYTFLTRVCLGNSYKVSSPCSLEKPPCVVPKCRIECNHIRHNSVIVSYSDTLGNSEREFILYEPYSSYPEFLIEYETTHDS
jgi:hypothetical protein